MAFLEDIALNQEGNFIVAPDGDAVTITETDVVLQDLADELMTYLGMLYAHSEYGGRLQEYIKSEHTTANTIAISREIVIVIKKHPNVVTESVSVISNGVKKGVEQFEVRLNVIINGELIESGPLIIIISPEGVRVLAA